MINHSDHITTAEAAAILGVGLSRIFQFGRHTQPTQRLHRVTGCPECARMHRTMWSRRETVKLAAADRPVGNPQFRRSG